MSFSITDKTAIVTGASSGVGLAIARHFAEHGANVLFADADMKALRTAMGPDKKNMVCFAGDFREKLSRTNLLHETISQFGHVDILVNAARQVTIGMPGDNNSSALEEMIERNLRQNYDLSWLVAKRFVVQAESRAESHDVIGAIVNVSSIAAQRTVPELVEYSISCAAQDQLTRTMALALAPQKIRVNAVSFGSVMSKSLAGQLKENPGHRDEIIDATPLGRIAEAEDVAEAVQFLVSGSSRFITGQILNVDGGRSLLDRARSPYH
ncbi:MAG: SDR family oxidoreductase [Rhodobacteraceae bacterium]|nr:SDR family oxidoreductase [Paracoccaceae bacterium]